MLNSLYEKHYLLDLSLTWIKQMLNKHSGVFICKRHKKAFKPSFLCHWYEVIWSQGNTWCAAVENFENIDRYLTATNLNSAVMTHAWAQQ